MLHWWRREIFCGIIKPSHQAATLPQTAIQYWALMGFIKQLFSGLTWMVTNVPISVILDEQTTSLMISTILQVPIAVMVLRYSEQKINGQTFGRRVLPGGLQANPSCDPSAY